MEVKLRSKMSHWPEILHRYACHSHDRFKQFQVLVELRNARDIDWLTFTEIDLTEYVRNGVRLLRKHMDLLRKLKSQQNKD